MGILDVGIDYGMGMANIDHETGIRYGVISQNTIGSAWHESSEADYGNPLCPNCEREFEAPEGHDPFCGFDTDDGDYQCPDCGERFEAEDAWRDEPLGWFLKDDEYAMEYSESLNSIYVIKSPYYTTAQFCSPCCPGAGDLDSYMEDGVQTYYPGPDFFDGEPPFPIYRVGTDEFVLDGPDQEG